MDVHPTAEHQLAAQRYAMEQALQRLRVGDVQTASAWLAEGLRPEASRELVRWCTAIGGALRVAHERVAAWERGEWPDADGAGELNRPTP